MSSPTAPRPKPWIDAIAPYVPGRSSSDGGIVSAKLDFTQPALNAQLTATAAREWMAVLGYRFAGRIDSIKAP